MRSFRQRAARLVRALAFTALLLVPLVESGHRHAGDAPSAPCSVCVVVHHAPLVFAPVAAIATTEVAISAAVVALVQFLPAAERSPAAGRAPPSPSQPRNA